MLDSLPNFPADRQPRILFLGAHCDDIEIGCGGTIDLLLKAYPAADIRWIVFSSNDVRAQEAVNAANAMTEQRATVFVENFRNGFFPSEFDGIKEYFETVKNQFHPDLIFTHTKQDGHQDHRVIADLTWNTFRSHTIFEYEIPKYDGDMGNPAAFIPLTREIATRKASLIIEAFPSQQSRQWFTEDTLMGLMRLRGIQCDAQHGFAEAFYIRKHCFSFK